MTRTSWKKPETRQAIEAIANTGLTRREAARLLGISTVSFASGVQKHFPELFKGFVSSGFYDTTAGRQTLVDSLKISNDMNELAKQLCVTRYNARQLVKSHFPQLVDCLAPESFYTKELCDKVIARVNQGWSSKKIRDEFDLGADQYYYIRKLTNK